MCEGGLIALGSLQVWNINYKCLLQQLAHTKQTKPAYKKEIKKIRLAITMLANSPGMSERLPDSKRVGKSPAPVAFQQLVVVLCLWCQGNASWYTVLTSGYVQKGCATQGILTLYHCMCSGEKESCANVVSPSFPPVSSKAGRHIHHNNQSKFLL